MDYLIKHHVGKIFIFENFTYGESLKPHCDIGCGTQPFSVKFAHNLFITIPSD